MRLMKLWATVLIVLLFTLVVTSFIDRFSITALMLIGLATMTWTAGGVLILLWREA